MSNAITGKNGKIYAESLVVEDCEDVWTSGDASSTISLTTDNKAGTNAVRATTVTAGAAVLLAYEDFASTDFTAYDGLALWIRASVNTAQGDLQILLDDTSGCVSPLESLDLPPLTANVWSRVFVRLATPASLGAVISVGLYQVTDLADGTFDVDDVRAVKKIDEGVEWSLTYTGNTVEVTNFDSAGTDEHVADTTGFTMSWNANKIGVPMAGFGTKTLVVLEEHSTVGRAWIGDVILNGLNETVTAKGGAIVYQYSGIGTGELQVPVA